jgi:hypothetical protein
MKASALQEFLRSLGGPLAAVGVAPRSLDGLRSVAQALEPLKDLDLDQLEEFLRRAADYRRTGAVPAIAVSGLDQATTAARSLGEAVEALSAGEGDAAGQIESRIAESQRDLRSALDSLARQFGLTVKFAEDKKWLSGLKTKAEVSRAVESYRRLVSQISEPSSYQSEAVMSGVETLAATDAKVLKAAATELGVSATGTGKKFVEAVLVKLTGIDNKPPRAAKKSKPVEPTASDEQVEAMTRTLQEMVARSKDPRAVPDAEIDAILSRVSSEFSTDQQKAIARSVTGNGGRSAKDAIDRLRADLTAVKRLLESQRV